ncbi:hypothetical protein H4Q26_015270 [Puccinia striiformis f. sp. tritici PST-130]|nr:hypothetical protein H4Q26_015270 [Puccinia striiformis f. sp. tritici PST-130]
MLSMAAGLMRLASQNEHQTVNKPSKTTKNTEYSAGSFNLSPQLNKKSNRTDSKTRKSTPLTPTYHGLDHIPKLEPSTKGGAILASKKDSFAFESATKRWPKILTQVIDHLLAQGKAIISLISGLKYEAARDKELSPLESNPDYTEHQNLIITYITKNFQNLRLPGNRLGLPPLGF